MPPCPVLAACDHSQGVALLNRLTHTASSIIVHLQHDSLHFLARVSRPAGRSVLKRIIKFRRRKTPPYGCKPFGSYSHLVISKIGLVVRLFESITTLNREVPNCTLSCGPTVVPAQDSWFVHRSDSPVLTFWKLEFSLNEHGVAPTSLQQPKCRTLPNPGRWTIPIAAVASDLLATWPRKQKSFRTDSIPMPSVAALTTAANSDSPLLKARTPIVLDHAYTNGPLHSATRPIVDFLAEIHPAKFASP